MIVQSLRLPQAITGPLVNALLLIAAALVGPLNGAAIGALIGGTTALAILGGIEAVQRKMQG